jgi:hypothetical protein
LEIVAARTFNTLYIYLDIIWLLAYAAILIYNKRYLAIVSGVAGGLVYFAVDYGIFYLALHTRSINGADPFWFLLWLSMSYGFTNFAWIWLLLDKDGKAVEWSTLTIAGWVAVAFLSQNFGSTFPMVSIQRGTTSYHGIMAFILLAGYTYVLLKNLKIKPSEKANVLQLLAIGIGVQFSWEAILLISNIRPTGVLPLIVNSLIETNLGMPYLYLIHNAITKRVNEDMTAGIRRPQ